MSDFAQGFLFCLCLFAIVGLSYFSYVMCKMSKPDNKLYQEKNSEKEQEVDKCTIRNKEHLC